VRGKIYKEYLTAFNISEAPTTLITAENIHEVKVAIIGEFFDFTKDNV
jgi:hypothetical protein